VMNAALLAQARVAEIGRSKQSVAKVLSAPVSSLKNA
jgi:hypothetical protein